MSAKDKIKRHYSEAMMHFLRSQLPDFYDQNKTLDFLNDHIYQGDRKEFYQNLKEHQQLNQFKDWLFANLKDDTNPDQLTKSSKSVSELLKDVHYDFIQIQTNAEVQSFKKYYRVDEALCTFTDPSRINRKHIFWLLKDNFQNTPRSPKPKREDPYSTSVLCIQIDKRQDDNRQFVSIKSRYNHTVFAPDSVYNNDLEQIVPGLTQAFENEFGFNLTKQNDPKRFVPHQNLRINNVFYHYNIQQDNKYFGNNLLITKINENNQNEYKIQIFDPTKFVTVDTYYLADLQGQKLSSPTGYNQTFIDQLNARQPQIKVVKNQPQESQENTLYIIRP